MSISEQNKKSYTFTTKDSPSQGHTLEDVHNYPTPYDYRTQSLFINFSKKNSEGKLTFSFGHNNFVILWAVVYCNWDMKRKQ